MLFNSIEYLFFLPLVFIIYWSLKGHLKSQNLFVLAASYFFYGLWDYRFLSLIIFSSVVDYFIGLNIHQQKSDKIRKALLATSICVNIGLLIVFKYYNFFIGSFVDLFQLFGVSLNVATLNIILPVGISFYTFQTLSYTIDIYKGQLKPTKSALNFFTFVAYFPQLVAGPIERAANLLPQIEKARSFDYDKAKDGMRQILWGMFKKVAIADNCAIYVDSIFSNQAELSGAILWLGGLLFVIQVYCDFSGYSDVAIGTSRILGINLMQNFSTPYFALNTTDLWRRWHISMSTWFRDYIFNPIALRYRRLGAKALYLATFLTFVLIGLWHGGNWTFIVFGFLQAIALSLEIATSKRRKKFRKKKRFLKTYYFFSWLFTMLFWFFVCIIFRSKNITSCFEYYQNMFKNNHDISILFTKYNLSVEILGVIFFFTAIMFCFEWFNKDKTHSLANLPKIKPLRYALYVFLSLAVLQFLNGTTAFIYFQF